MHLSQTQKKRRKRTRKKGNIFQQSFFSRLLEKTRQTHTHTDKFLLRLSLCEKILQTAQTKQDAIKKKV